MLKKRFNNSKRKIPEITDKTVKLDVTDKFEQ